MFSLKNNDKENVIDANFFNSNFELDYAIQWTKNDCLFFVTVIDAQNV